MIFEFPPVIQAGIAAGKYAPVVSKAGVTLGIARDLATGQFVGHAIGFMTKNGASPLIAGVNLVIGALQMLQTHKGFESIREELQSVQNMIGVLQSTTAVIGVGAVAGVALSAVNLYQTLKLKEKVDKLEIKLDKGFLDLKKALREQGEEIIEIIEEVAQDIKFEQHRLILVRAYGFFTQALDQLRSALRCQDYTRRNAGIEAARNMLFQALADYNNPGVLGETSQPGLLRRLECAWAMDQAIIATFQMQGELEVVSDRLDELQNKIRSDTVNIIEDCDLDEELDFLFPEICRIHDQDLAVLEYWKNQTDWMKSLSPTELKLLEEADFSNSDLAVNSNHQKDQITLAEPPEVVLYQDLQQKSYPVALRDQLILMMDHNKRRYAELYIKEQAHLLGYETIASNLHRASEFALANLYWYCKLRDDTKEE